MNKATLFLATLLVGGCSAAPAPKATHYWESDKASSSRYRVDEHRCQQDAGAASSEQPKFESDSRSYETYHDCMVSRGYVLRQY